MILIQKIKDLIPPSIKVMLRSMANFLIPSETLRASKNKWDRLALQNARYFVLTDFGEKITEEEFEESGEKDFTELIAGDEILAHRLVDFKDKTVLEIGCGIGRITKFLSLRFKKVFAVDISAEMIKAGSERLQNLANITFIANDGERYPSIEDSTVDFVFSYIVFQHMPDKKIILENLKEIRRVLAPHGVAKIQLRGLPTSKYNWFYGPSFSKDEIENILGSLGLKLIKTEGEKQRYFWIWFSK
ncbi:MAG: class I SAM-dependent methyltransferase [Candidatus Paceibacterota bacterium]|jgi:SAM-dependent methyltransferase